MPCVELFEEQDETYKESVLPSSVKKEVVVEAAHSFGWHKYTGFDGIVLLWIDLVHQHQVENV